MNIREATPTDDLALGELLVESFVTSYARKMPEVVVGAARQADLRDVASRRPHCLILVAEADEGARRRLVGTVTLVRPSPVGRRHNEAWIAGAACVRMLAISAAVKGGGVSSALMDEAERAARSWGAPAVCLHVRRGAGGVANFYIKRGYIREPAGDLDLLPEIFLEGYVKPA